MNNRLKDYKNSNLIKGKLKIDKPRGFRLKTILDKELQVYKEIDKCKEISYK